MDKTKFFLFIAFAISILLASRVLGSTESRYELLADPQERNFTFGINLALNASIAGSSYQQQVDTLIGLEIARDWWNSLPASSRTTRWGEVVRINLHVETWSEYNQGFTAAAYTQMCNKCATLMAI